MGDERSLGFPLRIGAIDIGSNALRFVAVEYDTPESSRVLEKDRAPVRLGHDVFLTGRISPQAAASAVEALRSFREKIDAAGVRTFKAVATSAVRESRNCDSFVARARKEANVEVHVITGSEEARLAHLAVKSRIPLAEARWILVDVGGGSVEVSLVDASGILWSESHTMGSVRLLEELTEAGDDPGRFSRLLTEYISTLRIPSSTLYHERAGFIATGGNIESLADLAVAPTRWDGVKALPLSDLKKTIELLSRMSYHQRVKELSLREDRADVILPAALVYERLAELCKAEEILVPYVGVQEGLVIDLLESLAAPSGAKDRDAGRTLDNALSLGRKYLFEEDHARQVTRLALALFDQLQGLHRLGREDRKVLVAAAMLHDIGSYISYKKHHKHSFYLLSQSELPGFSAQDMLLIANVARYHRKGEPTERHEPFAQLNGEQRERVVQLAALLRMADALDREHLAKVERLETVVDPGVVTIRIHGDGDLLLESWGLQKKSRLFCQLYNVELRLAIERKAQ